MEEIWKDIKGFEGCYQISNFGRVKALAREVGGGRRLKEKMLHFSPSNGYKVAHLYKNGVQKNFSVHRLVGEAFIPNPENKPCINHKDENKLNNHVNNLEWVTQKENANYGTKNARSGLKHAKATIQYDLKGNKIKRWESASAAARYFNVQACSISAVCKRRNETSCGYIWRYESEVAT